MKILSSFPFRAWIVLGCFWFTILKVTACDYIVSISANANSMSMANDTLCLNDEESPVSIFAVHLYNFTTYFNDPIRQLIWTRDGIPFDTTNESHSIYDGELFYVTTMWVNQPGNYQVWYYTPNNQFMQFGQVTVLQCSSDESNVNIGVTSIPIELGVESFSLYPNPATNGYVNVEFDQGIARIECFDNSGKKLWDTNIIGETLVQINTNGWKSGIYVIQLHTTKGLLRKKLIIN